VATAPREPHPPPAAPAKLVREAVAAWREQPGRFLAILRELEGRETACLVAVDEVCVSVLPELWRRGWTPLDLLHVLSRQLSPRHVGVAAEQVLACHQGDGRDHQLHPRWREQLAGLEERRRVTGEVAPAERLRLALEVLALVVRLPEVTRTIPVPGERWSAGSSASHLDARVLDRVLALLAKAESTTFEAEAEAFTAKAQELIARHAIDEALLHDVCDVGEPAARRVLVDDPYASAKAYLVQVVADANHCRSVQTPALGWVTVFGYDHDLDAVELLAASLLTQATAGMVRAGPKRDLDGRSVTRSFRRAFLIGFAERVGERLRRATREQVSVTAESDQRLLPVLAARDERVRAAQQAAFPALVQREVSLSNTEGWHAGRAAAELADLGTLARGLR
jgi:hypothetical protein